MSMIVALELALVAALLLASGLVVSLCAMLAVECAAALLARPGCRLPSARLPGSGPEEATAPRLAVLVPAHDEAATIGATVQALRPELRPGDRLVVIADNCADATAALAREAGAEVIERDEPDRRGKGFALERGVAHLATAGPRPAPAVIVFLDADCRVSPGGLQVLAAHAAATGGPVQAEYLLEAADASPRSAASALALLVRNRVRARGLTALGAPCPLTGSGMAVPRAALEDTPLGGGALVEDMVLGVELALRGRPPRACPEVSVRSPLPRKARAAANQRRRWEHGHLAAIGAHVPRLLAGAVRQRRLDLLVMALDHAVPPISVLVFALGALAALALVGLAAGGALASWGAAEAGGALASSGAAIAATLPVVLGLAAGGLVLLGSALAAAWWRLGRRSVPAGALRGVPGHLVGKLPLYASLLVRGPERRWIRTERDEGAPASNGEGSWTPPSSPPPSSSPSSGGSPSS